MITDVIVTNTKPETWAYAAAEAVAECQFPEYTFEVQEDKRGEVYLRASYWEDDTITRKRALQYTRRWLLSQVMSKSEIVATAFKCVITSMEHRTREWFLYRGRAIYQPHYDVDALHAICIDRHTR